MEKKIEKIPIEEAMKILKDSGIDVTQEEAEKILDFLCMLTQLILHECFERDED